MRRMRKEISQKNKMRKKNLLVGMLKIWNSYNSRKRENSSREWTSRLPIWETISR